MNLFSKNPKRYVKQCFVYISKVDESALVAKTYNHGGMFAEIDEGVHKSDVSKAADLGQLIINAFSECKFELDFDYSNMKKSDWPAYKKSGYKTIKRFEKEYSRYSIQGANEHNVTYLLLSEHFKNGIQLMSGRSSGSTAEEIGIWVVDFHSFFQRVEPIV